MFLGWILNKLPFLRAFVAIGAFGVAGIWVVVAIENAEETARALAMPPPRPVLIEDFDPLKDIHLKREVSIIAQIDGTKLTEIRRRARFAMDRRVIAPLYATDAKSPFEPALGFIFDLSERAIQKRIDKATERGAIGPIILIEGEAPKERRLRSYFDGTEQDAYAEMNAQVVHPAIVVTTRVGERSAIADPQWIVWGLPAAAALFGAFQLLLLWRHYFAGKRRPRQRSNTKPKPMPTKPAPWASSTDSEKPKVKSKRWADDEGVVRRRR